MLLALFSCIALGSIVAGLVSSAPLISTQNSLVGEAPAWSPSSGWKPSRSVYTPAGIFCLR